MYLAPQDGTEITWLVESGRRGASSTDVWNTATWDAASWDGGSNVDFSSVSEELIHSFTLSSGKDRFGRRFKASSVVMLLDNKTGSFTPISGKMQPGDYVSIKVRLTPAQAQPDVTIPDGFTWFDQVANLWTNRTAKILGDDAGSPVPVVYDIFYGRIDEAFDTVRGGVDTTKVVMYDIFAELAAVDKDAQGAIGAGEDVFTRVDRIGNNASEGYGGLIQSGTPGAASMQATTLAKNALEEMQLTVESEGGDLWADRGRSSGDKGRVQVRGRDWLTTDAGSTVPQWFLGSTGLPLVDANISRDQQLLVNDATFSNTGGVSQNVVDTASVQRYGTRTFRRLDLVAEDDTQSQFLAARAVANLKDIRPRMRSASVDVVDLATGNLAAQVFMGDLVNVTVASINGWAFTSQSHVIGIVMRVVDREWTVTLNLDDAFVDNVDGAYSSAFSNAFRLG